MSAEETDPRRAWIGFLLSVGLIAAFAAAKAVLFDTLDPDCFWHLRVADQLLRDGIGPLVDHLSFASSRLPWTPYSWLAELGMRWIWNTGGYRLAVATQALVQAAIVVAMAACCLEYQARFGPQRRLLAAAAATAAGTFLSLPYLSFRPVTAALLLLWIITFLILRDRARGERTAAVWLVLPLTAVLTNLHLFSFLVPAVLLVMTIASVLEESATWPRTAALTAGATLAFAATPHAARVAADRLFLQRAGHDGRRPGDRRDAKFRPRAAGCGERHRRRRRPHVLRDEARAACALETSCASRWRRCCC